MKISRLHIDQFAVEDYPTITKDNVGGEDLFIKGENRSGKTLTVNALLYALYGPRATLGVQPGRRSDVQIQFDNDHVLYRGGGGRSYDDGDETVEKDAAEDKIEGFFGPQELTDLQFVHSETDKLPLSRLSADELLTVIRRVDQTDLQTELEELQQERETLEQELEQVRRTELKPIQRELDDLEINRYERRLEKIEHLHSLIETDRIETIKQRLLENQERNDELEQLYNRKRTIEQELRKKRRKLREEQRYTQEVNDLIINAIEELTCPVCDHVVAEETAKRRLNHGKCPQCGRDRTLDDLKADLREKVETADDTIDELNSAIEGLEDEKAEIEDEIETIQASTSDLSDLNDLTKHTLEKHDYDIDAVAAQTKEELEQYRAEVDRLTTQKQDLEEELEAGEKAEEEMTTALDEVRTRIATLRDQSYEEIVVEFQEKWSANYETIASELGLEIHIEEDGTVLLPGNEGPRKYGTLSTGEARLVNIAFAHTVAMAVRDNELAAESFEVVVLDEPFANLEEEERENAIEFITNSDLQYIIMSSNEGLEQYFDPHQVEDLQTMPIQLTWDDMDV